MLIAGYRWCGAAMMWSIQDREPLIIAEKFYGYLLEAGGDSTASARLRAGRIFARWVLFIYPGICSPSRPATVP